MAEKYTFDPDYASPPGETLRETLEFKRMSRSELSINTGLTTETINEIIAGVAPITPDMAKKLERATGVSSRFWNNREASYRQAIVIAEGSE